MAYGYAEYNEILKLLEEFKLQLNHIDYEKFKLKLVDILKL